MRGPKQTSAQAQQQYKAFVADRLQAAKDAQFGTFLNPNGEAGLFNNALEAFGVLLHAVTDETSPAHGGFQPWEWGDWCDGKMPGCDPGSVESHIKREDWSAFTPQRQQQAIDAARRSFLDTFGSRLYWNALNGNAEPKACVEVSDSATGAKSKGCQ